MDEDELENEPFEIQLAKYLLEKGIHNIEQLEQLFEPNFFAVIPVRILESKMISANAKLLFAEILALSKKSGKCFAKNKTLADRLGLKEDTIPVLLKQLSGTGLILIDVERNAKGTYRNIEITGVGVTGGVYKDRGGGALLPPPGVYKDRGHNRNITKEIKHSNISKDIQKPSVPDSVKPLKIPSTSKKEYGNKEINELIATFKEKTGLQQFGESDTKTRQFANTILKKYTLEQVIDAIEWLLEDKFWDNNLTKLSQLYYQMPKYIREFDTVTEEVKPR